VRHRQPPRTVIGVTGTGPAAFTGFPEQALGFYEGLEADNSKSYWTDQLAVYESCVRGPMLALLAELEPEFGPGRLFRPHRDVRFSRDKSPYKTHLGALAGDGGLYVQVSAEGLMLAGGYYTMAKDQLERYRAAVLADGPGRSLSRITSSLQRAGFELVGEQLARAPRGVDPQHPRIDLLRHKGIAGMQRPPEQRPDDQHWLDTAACRQVVEQGWRQLLPLCRWLARHVGPSQPQQGDQAVRPRSAGRSR
jgi:uncharacterized protein (TIGR02453 family)